jgi:hypothetical protein
VAADRSGYRGRAGGEAVSYLTFHGDEATLRACQAGEFRGGTYDVTGHTLVPLQG